MSECQMTPRWTWEEELMDGPGGVHPICLLVLFPLKVHGKELVVVGLGGCDVEGERVEEGRKAERESLERKLR